MKYSLNDIERTLLSAYMDGELAPTDAVRAEALLEHSEEARTYLGELRAVEAFSTGALTVGLAVAPGAGVAKLTGGAIEAAAKKALVAKAAATTAWGVGGAIGAVATVAVAVTFALKSPDTPPVSRVVSPVGLTSSPRTLPALSVADIDTSNLIVPQMTPHDLVAFAEHGTLPLGDDGQRCLTVVPQGNDSMTLEVHSVSAQPSERATTMLAIARSQTLDSIERVVRTSVFHSKDGLALRADLPALRLDVIKTLKRVAPSMSAELRARLDRTRAELVRLQQPVRPNDNGSDEDEPADAPVLFRMFQVASIDEAIGDETPNLPPMHLVVGVNGTQCVAVERSTLRDLQVHGRPPLPPPAPFAGTEVATSISSNPSGVRVVRRTPSVPRCTTPPAAEGSAPAQMIEYADTGSAQLRRNRPDGNIYVRQSEEIRIEIDQSINDARESLRMVDSLMQRIDRQVRQRLRGNDDQPSTNGPTSPQGGTGNQEPKE